MFCPIWVEFAIGSCIILFRGFFSGFSGFFPSAKTNIPNTGRPFSYSQYWTGTSLQLRLMRRNIMRMRLMPFSFKKKLLASVACKFQSITENTKFGQDRRSTLKPAKISVDSSLNIVKLLVVWINKQKPPFEAKESSYICPRRLFVPSSEKFSECVARDDKYPSIFSPNGGYCVYYYFSQHTQFWKLIVT